MWWRHFCKTSTSRFVWDVISLSIIIRLQNKIHQWKDEEKCYRYVSSTFSKFLYVNIFISITLNKFKNQWYFQCWSQSLIKNFQNVLCFAIIGHLHCKISAAILTFCKMSIFVDDIFWKCRALTYINVFQKCS